MRRPHFSHDDQMKDIQLHRSQLYRMDGCQPGTEIICTYGALWVTQQGDVKDYVLLPGQHFTCNHPETVLVQAVPDASLRLIPPVQHAHHPVSFQKEA